MPGTYDRTIQVSAAPLLQPTRTAVAGETADGRKVSGKSAKARGASPKTPAQKTPGKQAPRNQAQGSGGHRERLRQRFLTEPAILPDYELLEMILFAARTREDTKPLAKRLIARFGSLAGVLNAEPARLGEVEGAAGPATLAAIRVVREAMERLARAEILERPVIASWQALLDYCQIAMAHRPTEQFRILFLDRRHALIADELQQRGTIDHTPVYPREVVKRALELGASGLIMVHNHPSGDPTPSRADIDMTRQVRDAAGGVGIALHDHLVIGQGQHASFKSLGLL